MICAVCQTVEATQKHHLIYNPSIMIHVCVPCHERIHKNSHGVGRGKQQPKKEKDTELKGGRFFPLENLFIELGDTEKGKAYLLKSNKEILTQLCCTCGEYSRYNLFIDNKNTVYLRCCQCGADAIIENFRLSRG